MRGSPNQSNLKPATIRRYLAALRDKQFVAAATELTYREPLADFLRKAAHELGFGAVIINAELSMPLAGKPDFQVANANGAPIGYGETKTPGSVRAEKYAKAMTARLTDADWQSISPTPPYYSSRPTPKRHTQRGPACRSCIRSPSAASRPNVTIS